MNKLDKTIEYILYALLAFSPFAFGAVRAWSEQVVITLSGAMLICLLIRLYITGEGFRWTLAYVPVFLFVCLAAFQLVSLPASVVGLLSPNTVAEKTDLLTTLPGHVRPALDTMTLSFYTHASKHDLRIIFAVASVFVVVVNTFRTRQQIIRLLTAITVIGAAVALLALAQVLTMSDSIYWAFKVPHEHAYSGPFVNHSHYAQFMNLCIGAAMGLLFVMLHSSFTGRKISPSVALDYCLSEEARGQWFIAGFVIVAAATVFISLSRGGMLSMLIAAAFTTLVLSSRHSIKGRGWIMTVMALGAFICVLYIGFDAVYERFSTLHDSGQYEDRWTMFTSIAAEFKLFPLLGTGIGTYSVIYPMFDNTLSTAIATHAENEYAQAIAETGFLGFGVLCVFGVIVWSAFVKNVRSAQVPIRSAAYGLGFGLLAILIHSLSDFGQHLPANAMLTATFCGLLISLTKIDKSAVSHQPLAISGQKLEHPAAQRPGSSTNSSPGEAGEEANGQRLTANMPAEGASTKLTAYGLRLKAKRIPAKLDSSKLMAYGLKLKAKRPAKITASASLAVAVAILAWSFITANDARISEHHFDKCLKLESIMAARSWQADNQDYIELISNAQKASDYSPGDVKYRHWLNVYRWRSLSRNTDPVTGEVILPPEGQQWIRRLADEFYLAVLKCPTYGPSWCMAGQLESFVLGDSAAGTAMIEKGCRLAPCDPTVNLIAGRQQVLNFLDSTESKANGQQLTANGSNMPAEGDSANLTPNHLTPNTPAKLAANGQRLTANGSIDTAVKRLTRAVQLDASLFTETADIFINQLNRPDLALDLAGENIGRLSRIANMLSDSDAHSELAETTRVYITDILEKRASEPDAPAGVFASLAGTYRRQKDHDRAIENYRKALTIDYGQTGWRYTLACLLAEQGSKKEAIHQARIVLRLNPNHRQAKKLIADLSVESAP